MTKILTRMKRPESVRGTTTKTAIACGECFVTVDEIAPAPDDLSTHIMFEVLSNIGKSGTCARATNEALCRTISLALQHGVPPEVLVKTLKGINCGDAHASLPSCATAVAVAMETWMMRHNKTIISTEALK